MAGATPQSRASRLAVLQVNRCLSWRLSWQSVGQTSTSKFAAVAKPKMLKWVVEACRRFQEPNHAAENGGPRRSTHLRQIQPPSSGHGSGRAREEEAGKPLGTEEDAKVHPRAKGGGLCLRPAFVGASPTLANGRGRWIGQGHGEERRLARREKGRSGKLPGP